MRGDGAASLSTLAVRLPVRISGWSARHFSWTEDHSYHLLDNNANRDRRSTAFIIKGSRAKRLHVHDDDDDTSIARPAPLLLLLRFNFVRRHPVWTVSLTVDIREPISLAPGDQSNDVLLRMSYKLFIDKMSAGRDLISRSARTLDRRAP